MVFAVNFTVFAPTRTTPAFAAAALARTNRTNNTAFLIGPSSILRFTIVKKGLQCPDIWSPRFLLGDEFKHSSTTEVCYGMPDGATKTLKASEPFPFGNAASAMTKSRRPLP